MNPSSLTQPMGFVAAVRPIRQDIRGAESGPTPTPPLDLAGIQQRLEHQHLVPLPSGQQDGHRPSPPVTLQVDFGSEAPLRATKRFVTVPFFAPAAL